MVMQELKQLERQQHKQDQSRVSAELATSALQSLSALNSSSNGTTTDHLDDFVARIDKLRQVGALPCAASIASRSQSSLEAGPGGSMAQQG